MTRGSRLHLVIERLVVDGIDLSAAERARLTGAISAGLADLVAESPPRGLRSGAHDRLPAPGIAVSRRPGGAELGREVAGALHSALAPRGGGSGR